MEVQKDTVRVIRNVHPHGNMLDMPPGRYLVATLGRMEAERLAQKMNDGRLCPHLNHVEVEY